MAATPTTERRSGPLTAAQSALVQAHWPLIRQIARRAWRRHLNHGNNPGGLGSQRGILVQDDFLSAAADGACVAARAYTKASGMQYATFCRRAAAGEISDMLRRHRYKPVDPGAKVASPHVGLAHVRGPGRDDYLADHDAPDTVDMGRLPDGTFACEDGGLSVRDQAACLAACQAAAQAGGMAAYWPVAEVVGALQDGVPVTQLAATLHKPPALVAAAVAHLRRCLATWGPDSSRVCKYCEDMPAVVGSWFCRAPACATGWTAEGLPDLGVCPW